MHVNMIISVSAVKKLVNKCIVNVMQLLYNQSHQLKYELSNIVHVLELHVTDLPIQPPLLKLLRTTVIYSYYKLLSFVALPDSFS